MKRDIFDVLSVELEGSNLIEASAGTGKTYSIGILVLRLLLEKNVPIEKILMVTFTNAAVDELSERIRRFVRLAYSGAKGGESADETISKVVKRAINSEGREIVVERLQNAVLFLDEISVFTIHGFCQRTLGEFAFETGQMFGVELVNNEDELIRKALNEFWRKEIATLPEEVLSALWKDFLVKDSFERVI